MLTFPKSLVDRFKYRNSSLRYGQAFYLYAKLHKICDRADKDFCDKLFNEPNEDKAKNMIASRTDRES